MTDFFDNSRPKSLNKPDSKPICNSADNYRIYKRFSKNPRVRLEKKIFGYGTEDSVPVMSYEGSRTKTAGFSTTGDSTGGGWIKADLNTPLSTADIHTCAVLNLVDKKTNQQFLYHVYRGYNDGSTPLEIEKFLKNKFPSFTKVNIIPGDQIQTNVAVNNSLAALKNINNNAEIKFYHLSSENPEIVACGGELSFIERKNKKMTFTEVANNFS